MCNDRLQYALRSFYKHLPEALKGFRWVVACSGGLDSVALLHCAARLAKCGDLPPVRAIHVHHGLLASADDWQAYVETLANSLDIPVASKRVQILSRHKGLEAAAREARYEAFYEMTDPDEIIVLAHHADDQAETVLFRLLRGTSLRGLSGMRPLARYKSRWIARPWLHILREHIVDVVQSHGWYHVEDPTNRDQRFTRNKLRHTVMPHLDQILPGARINIARSADVFAEQSSLLNDLAEIDLKNCLDGGALLLQRFRELSTPRRLNLLVFWWQKHGELIRSQRWLEKLDFELCSVASDTKWAQKLERHVLLIGQGKLFMMPLDWQQQLAMAEDDIVDVVGCVLKMGPWRIVLCSDVQLRPDIKWCPLSQYPLPKSVTWRLRRSAPRTTVKKLFQQSRIPAFLRPYWPIVQLEDRFLWLPGVGFSCQGQSEAVLPEVRSVSLLINGREVKLLDKFDDVASI